MIDHRQLWRRIHRATTPSRSTLRSIDSELTTIGAGPLPQPLVSRLVLEVERQRRQQMPTPRAPYRGVLLLLCLLLALVTTASVSSRSIWPVGPALLPITPLDEAFAILADDGASPSRHQLAMGVIDKDVFAALTGIKSLATGDSVLAKLARQTLARLDTALLPAAPPAFCDVPRLLIAARNTEADNTARAAAMQALGTCIAAGMTALREARPSTEDTNTIRDFYVQRLREDVRKAAEIVAITAPAAPASPPPSPGTQPSAK